MVRHDKHIVERTQRALTLLIVGLAMFAVSCGDSDAASGVASLADTEVATATPEQAETEEEPATAVEDTSVATEASDAEEESGTAEASDTAAGDDPGAASDQSDASGEEEPTDEEMALAFVACMRATGIEMSDPTVLADGSIQMFPPGGAGQLGEEDFQAAAPDCVYLIEDATFFQSAPNFSQIEDDLLPFAQCLRDQGLDVNDPNMSEFIPGRPGSIFGPDFDPQDPANADAISACQDLLPAGVGGG